MKKIETEKTRRICSLTRDEVVKEKNDDEVSCHVFLEGVGGVDALGQCFLRLLRAFSAFLVIDHQMRRMSPKIN